ncbi:MAG: polysaccharide export protein, partial [Alphaproteobacteria bacterium]|nr:polysaccharide export protein [Alphaproteobacteria bacterium]
TSGVVIVHANDASKTEQPAREDATVMPGDIVRVPERFF